MNPDECEPDHDLRLGNDERLGALVEVQRMLARTDATIDRLFDRFPELALSVVHADGAGFELVDGDAMICRAVMPVVEAAVGLRFPMDGSLSGEAIRLNQTLRCDDTETDGRVALMKCREFGLRSVLATVIRDGTGPIGVLKLFGYVPKLFGPVEADALELLAEALSAFIRRKRADDDVKRSLHVALGIAGIQRDMVALQGNLQVMMDLMVGRAHELTGATGSGIATNDGDSMLHRSSSGLWVGEKGMRVLRAGSLVGLCADSGELLRCDDAETDARVNVEVSRKYGARSLMAAPLRMDGKVGGVLYVASDQPHAFSQREAATLNVLAQWMEAVMERGEDRRRLEKSEAVLAIAGRVARVAGWSFDLRSQVLSHSEALDDLLDLPPGSAYDINQGRGFYVPQSRACLLEAAAACERDGTSYDLELELVTAKGRRIDVRSIGQAVRDKNGTIVGTQGAIQDISDKKQVDARFRALAARLTSTLESITDALYTLDTDWRFTYINGEAERMLQVSGSDAMGRTIWDVLPGTVGSEFERQSRSAIERNEAVRFDVAFVNRKFWVEVQVYPSKDGLTVYGRDITRQHLEQEQLKLLGTSIANMNDVVVISEADATGSPKIVFVNDAFVRCTGYSREEALGEMPTLLHGPSTQTAELDRIRTALHAGDSARAELVHYRKDGSTYWVELEVVPVRSAEAKVTHWIGVQRETTERRQAQEQLRSLNETLESRVIERTTALELARHDAEEASRAKSAFVATMSHEIRTPMNGVIGMIDVLGQTELASDQTKMLDLARDAAYSLMGIIEDILDFSKIEAGKVELEYRPISAIELVENVCSLIRGAASGKNVELLVRIDPALARPVLGDAVRLRQILVNLVNNAVKFSARGGGGGRVTVSATAQPDLALGMSMEITVEDNGIGMSEATLGKLFSPFSQGDASTTRRFGGTGLGLTISKLLVELMRGRILVRSEPDVGSTFTVRLPLEFVADDTGLPIAAQQLVPSDTKRVKGGLCHPDLILVAEDNPMNQEVISAQLKLVGFRAEIAENGREALALWQSGRFALLLTDLQMPEMDGYELARKIRSEEDHGDRTPIVALTANALKDEASRCMEAGMDEYLTKPVKLTVLAALLERYLGAEPRGS